MADASVERKLTTILAADVVEYSRMMSTDEEATLHTLQAYLKVIDELIAKHGGRIFKTAGDAVLAEFASAVEAVRCAVSIQEDLRVRNSERAPDSQMWLRIGINVGDVMLDDGDLFGDGVNVAARLEGLAEKGGICISSGTFEQVKNKLSIGFKDIGSHSVKNIPEPISAYQLVPGDIAVEHAQGFAPSAAGSKAGRLRWRWIASLVGGLAILVVAGLLLQQSPFAQFNSHAHDGRWKVVVSSKTGCRNNAPIVYEVTVNKGKIDAPHHRFPKVGLVSAEGDFIIRVKNGDGLLMNTQSGKISGRKGTGQFIGRKPTCTAALALERLD
ncbi:MAG: adenylate/guanylate cyclase domain-containing protein [Hyphomicrobiaceae bacterium]